MTISNQSRNKMKQVEKLANDELYLELRKVVQIANQAASKAKAENLKFGIPKIFWRKGTLYYELPDGRITTNRPEVLEEKSL